MLETGQFEVVFRKAPWKNPQPSSHISGGRIGGNERDLTSGENLLLGFETDTQTTLAALLGKHNRELRGFQVADPNEITRFDIGGRQKSALWIHKGQERHDASTLHSVGEVTLLFGCKTCQAAGKNLPAFRDEFLEEIHILVIDGITGLDRRKTLLEEGAGHCDG